MNKEFIPYDVIRNNAIKMAYRIYREGFIPDVIYVSLRGGAYIGNVLSEYFKIVRKEAARPVFYAAVVARSYAGINQREQVRIDGWTYSPEYLRSGDKVLIVDDIYKICEYRNERLPIVPDYWCRKHILKDPSDEVWIHYMSHELVGLSESELESHYYPEDPDLREAFGPIKK